MTTLLLFGALVGAIPAPASMPSCGPSAALMPPTYYEIDLVPTRRVPGTGTATGAGFVTFERSPFGVSIAPDGSYRYSLQVRIENVRLRPDGRFVVWAASADLANVRRLGVLDETLTVAGDVAWNKFLVIVSLESSAGPLAERWQGPIVMRGMSRSGMMHTMAGHGAFEAEPCVKYGYR